MLGKFRLPVKLVHKNTTSNINNYENSVSLNTKHFTVIK